MGRNKNLNINQDTPPQQTREQIRNEMQETLSEVMKKGLILDVLLIMAFTVFDLTRGPNFPTTPAQMYSISKLLRFGLANGLGAVTVNILALRDLVNSLRSQPTLHSRKTVSTLANYAYEITASFIGFSVFALGVGAVNTLPLANGSDEEFGPEISIFAVKTMSAASAVWLMGKLKSYMTDPELLQLFTAMLITSYGGEINEVIHAIYQPDNAIASFLLDTFTTITAAVAGSTPVPVFYYGLNKLYQMTKVKVGAFFENASTEDDSSDEAEELKHLVSPDDDEEEKSSFCTIS